MTEARVAVVTGGASGIGEAALRRFAEAGWRAVSADVAEARGAAIAAELRAAGRACDFHRLDVTAEDAVEAFVASVTARHGRVDAVVNSAGVLQNAVRVTAMDMAEYDRIQAVNVRGTLLVGRAFARTMSEAGRGSIVNLCSLTAFRPSGQPAYAMGKAALRMLTEVMAAELGPAGVRVNAVAPGYVLTPAMQARIDSGQRDPQAILAKSALGRFVQPNEVAEAILFLCSDAASAITGATLPVDCGWLAYSAYTAYAAVP